MLTLETTDFCLKMVVKSDLKSSILKFYVPSKKYLLKCCSGQIFLHWSAATLKGPSKYFTLALKLEKNRFELEKNPVGFKLGKIFFKLYFGITDSNRWCIMGVCIPVRMQQTLVSSSLGRLNPH